MTFALLISLSIVGCSNTDNPFKQTGEIGGYTYPKFMDTDWGMTIEQTMTALGKTESDFEKKTGVESFPDAVGAESLVYYTTNIDIAGEKAEAILCFMVDDTAETGEPAVGLISATVSTSDKKMIKLANEAKTDIESTDKYIGLFEAFQFLEKTDMVGVVGTYYEDLFAKTVGLQRKDGDAVEWVKDSCNKFPINDIVIIENGDKTTVQYSQEFIARYKFFENLK